MARRLTQHSIKQIVATAALLLTSPFVSIDSAQAQSAMRTAPTGPNDLQAPAATTDMSVVKLRTRVKSAPKKKKTTVQWRMRVSGKQWQNEQERTQYGELLLDSRLDHAVSDSILLHAWGFVAMRSAYTQSRYGEVGGGNAYGLFEGYIQAQPWMPLTFQAGILDQGKWDSPMLIDMVPFPAVLENIKFGEDYSVELRAEQAIPTSKSISTQAEVSEPTPAFLIETFRLAAEPKDGVMHASAFAGLWSFQGLPKQVAADSDGLGNTLIAGIDGKPRFKYNYEGWLAGGSTKFIFSKSVAVNFHGEMVQNARAPETYRNGQHAGASVEFKLPGEIELQPSYNVFFAESDVSPAAYTQTETAHNNRVGWWGSLAATFRKQGFKTALTVFDADVINPSVSQVRQQFFILKFETLYGSL